MNKENKEEFEHSNLFQWHNMGYTGKNIKVASPEKLDRGHGKMTVDTILQSAPDIEIIDFDYTKWGDNFSKFIDDCIEKNVDIIMNALMFSVDEEKYKALEKAKQHGIIFVTAIGNDNKLLQEDNKTVYTADNVFQVGAVALNNKDEIIRMSYSNKGKLLDYVEFTNIFDHEGDKNTGTSSATPFFAGKLACMLQYYNEYEMADCGIGFMEFIDDHLIDLGEEGKDDLFGKGFLRLPNLDEEVRKMNKPNKIIIDAGHGGKDAGGGNNIHWEEKEFTLKISNYQYDRFVELGIDVETTRFEDVYLSPKERTDIVKKSNADICISNHINVGGGEGVETIHSINNNGKLAKMIYSEIVFAGQKGRRVFSKEGKNGDYYYMHRDTGNVETVIVEYGFADNERDTQNLLTNWRNYAEAVVKSVCEYINVEYKEPIIFIEKVTEEPVINTKKTWQELELEQAIVDGRINTPEYWINQWEDNIKVKDVIGLVLKLTKKNP